MDLAKFVDLLNTKELFLPRVDRLSDPHEGSLTRGHINARFLQALHAPSSDVGNELMQEEPKYIRKLRGSTYVSCWCLNNHESEAMWRLYCGDKQGVAIKTTYKKLSETLLENSEMYIGRVTYIDFDCGGFQFIQLDDNWPPEHKYFYPFMHKRDAFSHESEVRIVKIIWPTKKNNKNQKLGIPLKLDLERIIDNIYVNPCADIWYFDVVKTIIRKFSTKLEPLLRHNKSSPFY